MKGALKRIVIARFAALDLAGTNLALDKPAAHASTYAGQAASLAVDGLYDTNSCTTTVTSPWLSVDLGQPYDVGHVTVTNDANINTGKLKSSSHVK